MNLEILKHAKDYIEKMANGINPLTGESVPDNDLINNIRISRCLFYVSGVLGEVLSNGGVSNSKTKKIPFNITREKLNKFEYSDFDLPISQIVARINDLNSNSNMAKLKATNVCNWLISIGLLVETEINGKKFKIPTEDGKNMGLYIEHKIGYSGEYVIVLYPKIMQQFIIDNFESLLEFLNK